MDSETVFHAESEVETRAIAARLAAHLQAGDVLCLRGDLGAGKTTFTRGLVRGLGSPDAVSSPTFTLIHEYPHGRLPIFHADVYRLRGPDELEAIGLETYWETGNGVTLIEWPERIEAALPTERLDIFLNDDGEDARTIRFVGRGPRWENTPFEELC